MFAGLPKGWKASSQQTQRQCWFSQNKGKRKTRPSAERLPCSCGGSAPPLPNKDSSQADDGGYLGQVGGPPDPGKGSLLPSSSHPSLTPPRARSHGRRRHLSWAPSPSCSLYILPVARRWQETRSPAGRRPLLLCQQLPPATVTQRGSDCPKDMHTGQSRLNRATSGRPLAWVASRPGANQTWGPLQPAISTPCARHGGPRPPPPPRW